MANYSKLKNIIDQVVRTNGQGDITGANLNQTLQQMVTDLGANYQYAGVATPSTNPGSPDQNVFYIATLAGTYSYFNSIVLPKGITVLRWNGSWSSTTLYTVDTGLTPESEALVQSGTVFEKFKIDGGPWDVSAHFPSSGPNKDGKFTLEYILTNANTLIPAIWRKGGMSICFKSISDNKYIQARCMAQNFTTDVTQWQGVDDEPVAGSNNLVKSGGVVKHLADNIGKYYDPALWTLIGNGIIDGSGNWVMNTDFTSKYLKIDNIRQHKLIIKANVAYNSIVSFVKEINFQNESSPVWANGESGRHVISPNTTETFTIPDDANYAIFTTKDATDRTPSSVCCIDGRLIQMDENFDDFKDEVSDTFSQLEHTEDSQSWSDLGPWAIDSAGKWVKGHNTTVIGVRSHYFSAVPYRGKQITITANDIGTTVVSFVKTLNTAYATPVDFATGEAGRHVITTSTSETLVVPADANYVIVYVIDDGQNRTPEINEYIGELSLLQKTNKIAEVINYCNVPELRLCPVFKQSTVITSGGLIGEPFTPTVNSRIHTVINMHLYKGTSLYAYVPAGYFLNYRQWDGMTTPMSEPAGWANGIVTIPIVENYLAIILSKDPTTEDIVPADAANIRFFTNAEISELFEFKTEMEKQKTYQYRYNGEKMMLDNGFNVLLYKTLPNWHNMQGGAIYGDYLVSIMATDEMTGTVTENGYIYNLATGEKLCNLLFGSTLGEKTYTMPHANQVSFGTRFYNNNSRFPLLYVSQVNGGNTTLWNRSERGVLVYDLQTEDDGETFTPVLVQAIIPDLSTIDPQTNKPVMEKYIGKYTPNYVYDTDKDQLVVLGYPNASWFDLVGGQPVAIFDAPLISAGEEVVLTESDVVDSYKLPTSIILQQSFYRNGRIYISAGMQGIGSVVVLDLLAREYITTIDLTQWSNLEPQFLGYWNKKLLYYTAGTSGNLYNFEF